MSEKGKRSNFTARHKIVDTSKFFQEIRLRISPVTISAHSNPDSKNLRDWIA